MERVELCGLSIPLDVLSVDSNGNYKISFPPPIESIGCNKSRKIVFCGNSGSGKTKMVKQLVLKELFPYHKHVPTLGVEVDVLYHNKTRYNIFDTAGKDKYRGIISGYYAMCEIAFVFEGGEGTKTIEDWVEEIREYAANSIIYVIEPWRIPQDILDVL